MKTIAIVLCFVLISAITMAQQNVGMGTTTPDPNAILELKSTSQGFLTPRLTTVQRTAMNGSLSAAQAGLLVFDTNDNAFYFWDGSQWTQVGAGGAGLCSTLEEAYNCGGPGSGRTIHADNGTVEILLGNTTNGTEGLTAVSSTGTAGTPTSAIAGQNSGFGTAVYAENTNAPNPYNTLEAHSNSSNSYTSALAGYYDGTGQGVGIYGSVYTAASGGGVAGVMGVNARTDGGYGMYGQGFNGVVGETNYKSGAGLWGVNNDATGSGDAPGIVGDGNYGVWGQTSYGASGIFGINTRTTGGWGVEGQGVNGVVGFTENGQGFGVYGENMCPATVDNNVGVAGLGWVGVFGESHNVGGNGYGLYSNGDFGATGAKTFMIDHPLHPETMFLKHFCIESPEVLNLYRGNIQLDANGTARIELPDYFSAINTNFSYQLTAIGKSMPGLYISKEIEGNAFEISGGEPNGKVAWMVSSERNDAYMVANPESKQAEVLKKENQKNKYLIPELYGKDKNQAIFVFPKGTIQKNIDNPQKLSGLPVQSPLTGKTR